MPRLKQATSGELKVITSAKPIEVRQSNLLLPDLQGQTWYAWTISSKKWP